MIIQYKSENISEEILKIKNENLNLIKTFKISENVIKILKSFVYKKLMEDVEYLIMKETNLENGGKNKNSQKISEEKYLKIETNSSQILSLCKTQIKLFRKYKNRIDNFVIRHILPLNNLLEEKFCDFHNSLKTELVYFKNFKLSLLKHSKDPNKIYSLKRFNYDKEILRNSQIRKKSEVFKLFFQILSLNYKDKNFKNYELKFRKNAMKHPNFLKFCLIFEKSSDMRVFLEEEFFKIKENFKEIWKYYKEIINIISNNLVFYRKIISEWKREDYIEILKNLFYFNDIDI